MDRARSRVLWGLLLILAGGIFLLQSLEIIPSDLPLFWTLAFGISGLVFLYVFLMNREQWWPIIPGLSLLGLGGLIGLSALIPSLSELWAALFLASISLAFWGIYFLTRGQNWWAIIPGGVLFSVAILVALTSVVSNDDIAVGVLFLGMGATFGLVYLLPHGETKMRWALIPGGILIAMGLIFITAAIDLLIYVGPLVLILIGGYLVLRAMRR
ncbi:MAG: hypothetical protein JXB35_05385 [Anaerolineae bacterium]|nr:hypothetical protein [Anaerolineae bacterium]